MLHPYASEKATGTRSGPLTLRRRQTVSRFAPHAPDASRFTRQIKNFFRRMKNLSCRLFSFPRHVCNKIQESAPSRHAVSNIQEGADS